MASRDVWGPGAAFPVPEGEMVSHAEVMETLREVWPEETDRYLAMGAALAMGVAVLNRRGDVAYQDAVREEANWILLVNGWEPIR